MAAQPDPFADLILRARAAESLGRFAEPVGDSAIDFYTAILADAPNHVTARERLDVILEDLFVVAESQLLARELEPAAATLAKIGRGNPRGSRLQFLSQQLDQLVAAQAAAIAPTENRTAESAAVDDESAGLQAELQSMVTLARLRLEQAALVVPSGDSARDYLLRAVDLGIAPADLAVLVEDFSQQAVIGIPQALEQGQAAQADEMLRTAMQLGSSQPELAALQNDVIAAVAASTRETDAALHARALMRIDDAQFIGGEDTAVELLAQLRSRGSDAAMIADLEARMTTALSSSVRQAITAGRWNHGDALISAFQLAGLDLSAADGLARDLTIARRQAQFLEQAVPIGELTVIESEPAAYPRAARIDEITGWVELHFTVDSNGSTKDIDVVAAQPADVFDASAVAALEQYLFAPVIVDERAYERRARLRMRFELD